MAASISRRCLNVLQKTLFIFPLRPVYCKKIPIPPYKFNSSVGYKKWYSSTSPAAKDNGEKTENSQEQGNEITDKEKEFLQEKEKLLEEINTLNDKYKRSLADNENIRTRMRREVQDAKQYGIQGFVKDLLEVADVLVHAVQSVPPAALEQGGAPLRDLFEGLRVTEAQLAAVLRRHGVSRIDPPLGDKFDPNQHEALFELEDPARAPGQVGAVTKVGYRLHERTVRPAMVGVVKAAK